MNLFDDPSFLDLSFALISAWARKPSPRRIGNCGPR
jgi:hypothetical protein